MTQTDFKNQVDNLMNILFGAGVASHATIIEQINYLVFLRSLSRKDDNAMKLDPSAEMLFSGELKKYNWNNLLILNAEELFNTLEEIFRRLPEVTTDQTIKFLFRDAHVKIFDKPTLRRLVHEIEKMFDDLEKLSTSGHTDIFGDMYEYLLSKLSQAGTLGSFRTPRHIVKFIVDIIDPKKGETILDPACGTAGFLVAALKHLEEKYTSEDYKKIDKYPMNLLSSPEREFVYRHTFTGYDSDFDMFKFGLMNLYLHKLEHPNIKRQNTLVDTAGDRTKWDVILANPPFAGALDIDSISEDLRMGTRSTEILFLRYIIDHLSSAGRAGVIVPEGVVFNSTNAHKRIRQMLVEDAGLWCVVSLPAGIFNPYAGVKTSILLFDKSLKNKVKEVLFVKIENDGFDLGANKRQIDKNDIPKALSLINNWKNNQKIDNEIGVLISKKEIQKNETYVLSVERYISKISENGNGFPFVSIDETCEILNGSTPKRNNSKYWNSGTIPWFTIDDVRDQGRIIKTTKQKITQKALEETSVKLLPENTVLICCTASVGEYAISKIPLTTNQQFNGLVVKDEFHNRLLPEYLFWISSAFKEKLIRLSSKTSFNFVSVGTLKTLKFPLPSIDVQKQIIHELEEYQTENNLLLTKIKKNNEKISNKIKEVWGE